MTTRQMASTAIKATPAQNAVAVLIMLLIGAVLAARIWSTAQENELVGPDYLNSNGEGVALVVGATLLELSSSGDIAGQIDLASAGLSKLVSGVQLLRDGSALVGDMESGTVHRCDFETDGCVAFWPKGGGAVKRQFKFHLDEDTGIFAVADTARHRLLVYEHHEAAQPLAESERKALRYPNRVWRDREELFHVADTNHHRIVSFALNGSELVEDGSFAAKHPQARPRHVWPVDAARDADGEWWVLLGNDVVSNADLVRFAADGTPRGRVELPEHGDAGQAITFGDALLVTDKAENNVYRVDRRSLRVTDFGAPSLRTLLSDRRERKARVVLLGQLATGTMVALLVGAIALAATVMRANARARRAASQSAGMAQRPTRLVFKPASHVPGVNWLTRDARIQKRVRLALWTLAVAPLLLLLPLVFLLTQGNAEGSTEEIKVLLGMVGMLFAILSTLAWFAHRAYQQKLGAYGSLLCIANHRGEVLAVPPEEAVYTHQMICVGPSCVAYSTPQGHVFERAEFNALIKPLLGRAQELGVVNLMVYQIVHRNPMALASIVIAIIAAAVVLVPAVFLGWL